MEIRRTDEKLIKDIEEWNKQEIQTFTRWQDPTIDTLSRENEKLKELCNKYEEEHKTTFETWLKDIEKIDKAIEYIKNKAKNNCWIDQYESCELIDILRGKNE